MFRNWIIFLQARKYFLKHTLRKNGNFIKQNALYGLFKTLWGHIIDSNQMKYGDY